MASSKLWDDDVGNGRAGGSQRPASSSSGRGSRGRGLHGGEVRRDNDRHETPPLQGVIERIKESFGFIDCLDQESSVFFHFSSVRGSPEDLQPGDEVEFYMGTDHKTRREVAKDLVRLPRGTIQREHVDPEEVIGTVTRAAPRAQRYRRSGGPEVDTSSGHITFSIATEPAGRTTWLRADQTEASENIGVDDKVAFNLAIEQHTNRRHAVNVRLVQRSPRNECLGIISSLKDYFGFIERADKPEEIFFHFSELSQGVVPTVGDNVSFELTNRQGKEIAAKLQLLPPDSVTFEETDLEVRNGVVQRSIPRSNPRRSEREILSGHISYTASDGTETIISFSSKDIGAEGSLLLHSLRPLDTVRFNICHDKRDGQQRATNVTLIAQHVDPHQVCEYGLISTVKDGFGFIKCAERDARMFFHFSECQDLSWQPTVGTEVEFVVVETDRGGKAEHKVQAQRVKPLPAGTVSFETIDPARVEGLVTAVGGSSSRNWKSPQQSSEGLIEYTEGEETLRIGYEEKNVTNIRSVLRRGCKVRFSIATSNRTGLKHAVQIELLETPAEPAQPEFEPKDRKTGFISALKSDFGFIELLSSDGELFFHFSEKVDGKASLQVGEPVTYELAKRSGKKNAIKVKALKEFSRDEEVEEEVLHGEVTRQLRSEGAYGGRLQLIQEGAAVAEQEKDREVAAPEILFGITSLQDPRQTPREGDTVSFQLAKDCATGETRAVNVRAVHIRKTSGEILTATVDSVKNNFGFINCKLEGNPSEKLFFHFSELKDKVVRAGDEVQFAVHCNSTGKYMAIDISILAPVPTQRPERLVRRREEAMPDQVLRPVLMRTPSGPDGTRGFPLGRGSQINMVPPEPPGGLLNASITEEEAQATDPIAFEDAREATDASTT